MRVSPSSFLLERYLIMAKLGSIEAGGTKFICALSDEKLNIIAKKRISTTTPEDTMHSIFDFFRENNPDAIGIGCFGPIGINASQPTYGRILSTPKQGWSNYNFLGTIKKEFNIPIYWTTDVNVAAYGEYKLGAGQGLENIVYWTVGTGIGAGAIVNGHLLRGLSHPEMGHMLITKNQYDHTKGTCRYHFDCLESLACGPAIEQRAGLNAQDLVKTDKQWDMEAYYLAQACVNVAMVLSPERIIFGGGVSNQEQLFPKIRQEFKKMLGNYLNLPDLKQYIVHAKLGNDAGTIGALLLAKVALKKQS